MKSGRVLAAVAILLAWFGGLGMLIRREYFRPNIERLAEAALRVSPGAVFYTVMQGDKQVGFASSTIDTATAVIEQRDYLVADIPLGGKTHRAEVRTNVTMTRTLRVKSFDAEVDADEGKTKVHGDILGDTIVRLTIKAGDAPADTQMLRIGGPILLPTLVPLAIALQDKPKVGKSYVLPVFDPTTMAPKDVRLDVRAESLFVVSDSSVYDSTSGRWKGVLADTIRGWQIVAQSGGGVGGWVDEQGRIVSSTQLGFRLVREPYEVAFENWRIESDLAAGKSGGRTVAKNRDVLEISAIAANKRLKSSLSELRVKIGGVPSTGFDLNGGRQQLRGDTLIVTRETLHLLAARYFPIVQAQRRAAMNLPELRAEPFLEVEHPDIKALADRIGGTSRDPRVIAERINTWVHDSLRKEITVGIPSALHVLHTRAGDCNEHTQLYVALARAAGIPARIAAGLVYLDGKFYYHAWPEVMLRRWVAVDPTFGQFPADAAHLRFVNGGLGRQANLLTLVGGLTIKVIDSR